MGGAGGVPSQDPMLSQLCRVQAAFEVAESTAVSSTSRCAGNCWGGSATKILKEENAGRERHVIQKGGDPPSKDTLGDGDGRAEEEICLGG